MGGLVDMGILRLEQKGTLGGAQAWGAAFLGSASGIPHGEEIEAMPAKESLTRLHSGSWINQDFKIWIGHQEDNRGWDLVGHTRSRLLELTPTLPPDRAQAAWNELYAAEGSDWFWWYSNRNNSAQNAMFDGLFRGHLQNVYTIIGLPAPDELKAPIHKAAEAFGERGITAIINPPLAADENAGAEWDGAGSEVPASSTGTMQQAGIRLTRVYYGYNDGELFFRVESRTDLAGWQVALYLSTPRGMRSNTRPQYAETDAGLALKWQIATGPEPSTRVYRAEGQGIWREAPVAVRANVRGRVVELALSRADLDVDWEDAIGFIVVLVQDHQAVETLPANGLQTFQLDKL